MITHHSFTICEREIQNSYLMYFAHLQYNSALLLYLCIPFTWGKGRRFVHPLISYIFLLFFFLGMVHLIDPESHFYQPCKYLFFREHTIKEESYLKLVFYITLLQSFKTLQYKTKQKTHFVCTSASEICRIFKHNIPNQQAARTICRMVDKFWTEGSLLDQKNILKHVCLR